MQIESKEFSKGMTKPTLTQLIVRLTVKPPKSRMRNTKKIPPKIKLLIKHLPNITYQNKERQEKIKKRDRIKTVTR